MTDKNWYVYMFATVMVVLVAAILATLATVLKPFQDKNVEIEKKKNILQSVQVAATPADADELYKQYIKSSIVVNTKGDVVEGDAFAIDLKAEYAKKPEERTLPLYEAEKDGNAYLIIPLRGAGMWDAIWGYISLEKSTGNPASFYNEVYGATFAHKSETPGLGAEIAAPFFQKQFETTQIFDEKGTFRSIDVVKGGAPATADSVYAVDAVSGGTVTSTALAEMIKKCLLSYEPYLRKQK